MTTAAPPQRDQPASHAAPMAGDRCNLWVTLKTRNAGSGTRLSLSADWPSLFLHFRASGLLVALPDEHPSLIDSEGKLPALRLLQTDGLGLGLTPADFLEGVGLCGGATSGGQSGWRCRDMTVLGVDDGGQEHALDEPTLVEEWLG